MRIVICDDHRLLAEALAAAIAQAGHAVVALALTPDDALEQVERLKPDVVLLDLTFPDGDSLEVAHEMVTRHPGTRTVMMTASDSVDSFQEALTVGVAGYVRKDEWVDRLLATLERCLRGERVLDEVLVRRLARSAQARSRERTPVVDFTPRERAVAELLQEGLNTDEMVRRLGISRSTVRTHVQAILNKLSVHSRVQAVALLGGPLPATQAVS